MNYYCSHENYLEALLERIDKSRQEVCDLIGSGDWQVWSARVTALHQFERSWHWEFLNDFPSTMPEWLDIDTPDEKSIAGAIAHARLPVDSRRCHVNSQQAMESNAPGYEQAFRIRLGDNSLFWVSERVEIVRTGDGALYMLGVCTPACADAIVDAMVALTIKDAQMAEAALKDPTEDMTFDELRGYARNLKSDSDMLARAGQWLTWAADVTLFQNDPPAFHWRFNSYFANALPPWFDVDRVVDEEMADTMNASRFPEDDEACAENARRALLSGVDGYTQVFRLRLRDDSVTWVEENVAIHTTSPGRWRLVGVCTDVTERKVTEARLMEMHDRLTSMEAERAGLHEELDDLRFVLAAEREALAAAKSRSNELESTDELTGVKSHRALRDRLKSDIASAGRHDDPVSLILLDIDGLRQFNADFGHAIGDTVLVEISQLLVGTARQCDTVARFDGATFAVIAPLADAKRAASLAERLRSAIETSTWRHRPVTATFGVATTGPDCVDVDAVLSRTLDALQQAKAAGRNRVVSAMAMSEAA